MSDTFRLVPISELAPGDVVRGWEDGDPYRATVVSVTPRPVVSYHYTGPLQWVYDVTYEGGHIAYTQDGEVTYKVLTS